MTAHTHTPRVVTQDQIAGLIRGLDNAYEYCGRTQAFDSQRTIRETSAALCLLDAERDALKAQNAELVAALDTYRLTRNAVIAGLPFSWTDVDKVVNAALSRARGES